jgi:hypothetical protein
MTAVEVPRCDGQGRRQAAQGAGRPHQTWMMTSNRGCAAPGHGQSPKEGAPSSTLCNLPLLARSIGQRPLRRMRDCAVCLSWRGRLHKVRVLGYSLGYLPLAAARLCAPVAPRASRKRDPPLQVPAAARDQLLLAPVAERDPRSPCQPPGINKVRCLISNLNRSSSRSPALR